MERLLPIWRRILPLRWHLDKGRLGLPLLSMNSFLLKLRLLTKWRRIRYLIKWRLRQLTECRCQRPLHRL